MQRWIGGIRKGLGVLMVVGVLAAVAPVASASGFWQAGYQRIILRNVYFYD